MKHSFIDSDFYQLTTPGCNYTRNYIDIILRGCKIQIVKNWAPTIKFTVSMISDFKFLMNRRTNVSSNINQ